MEKRCDALCFGGHGSLHMHVTERRQVKGFALRTACHKPSEFLPLFFRHAVQVQPGGSFPHL